VDAPDSGNLNGPIQDEQLEHELHGLVTGSPVAGRDDDHLQQDVGDLEPGRQPLTGEAVGNAPSIDEINRKSDFTRWLRPSDFPGDAATLATVARDEYAPDWVQEALDGLEGDRRFSTMGEVWDAVCATVPGGGPRERG
jgi:hypothetical protein